MKKGRVGRSVGSPVARDQPALGTAPNKVDSFRHKFAAFGQGVKSGVCLIQNYRSPSTY